MHFTIIFLALLFFRVVPAFAPPPPSLPQHKPQAQASVFPPPLSNTEWKVNPKLGDHIESGHIVAMPNESGFNSALVIHADPEKKEYTVAKIYNKDVPSQTVPASSFLPNLEGSFIELHTNTVRKGEVIKMPSGARHLSPASLDGLRAAITSSSQPAQQFGWALPNRGTAVPHNQGSQPVLQWGSTPLP